MDVTQHVVVYRLNQTWMHNVNHTLIPATMSMMAMRTWTWSLQHTEPGRIMGGGLRWWGQFLVSNPQLVAQLDVPASWHGRAYVK
jgi:hypothetical protein